MFDASNADGSRADKQLIYQQVAQLHIECIDQGFLPKLGARFLALMYQAIDEGEDSVLLVRRERDEIVGFVSGGTGMRPIYRRMLRRAPSLLIALAPSLVRPARLRRIFDILRYSGGASETQELPAAELLSIGVAGAYRGKGHAEALYQHLCAHFRRRGFTSFKFTVGSALTPAHRFYARMGAHPALSLTVHEGESSVVYLAALDRKGKS
jgi:ribosomal protein S18 acetylase RimI-like enzyme